MFPYRFPGYSKGVADKNHISGGYGTRLGPTSGTRVYRMETRVEGGHSDEMVEKHWHREHLVNTKYSVFVWDW